MHADNFIIQRRNCLGEAIGTSGSCSTRWAPTEETSTGEVLAKVVFTEKAYTQVTSMKETPDPENLLLESINEIINLGQLMKHVTASWVVAEIDRVIILSLYQSAVSNETKYRRLRLSCCNKLLTISQLPSSS